MSQSRNTWIFLSVAVLRFSFVTAIPNLFTDDPAQADHQASVCQQDGVLNCTYVNINFQALSEENNSILKVQTIGTLFLEYRDDYDGIVHLNYKNDDQTTGYLTYYAMQQSLIGTFTFITGETWKLAKCGNSCYVFYGVTEKKWTDYNEKGSKNKNTKKDKNEKLKIKINECKAKLKKSKETCMETYNLTTEENCYAIGLTGEKEMALLEADLNNKKSVNEQLKKEGIMMESKIALLENKLKTANEMLTNEGKTSESKRSSLETQLNKLQADNEKLKYESEKIVQTKEMELIQIKREIESKNAVISDLRGKLEEEKKLMKGIDERLDNKNPEPSVAKRSNCSIDIHNMVEPSFVSSSVVITENRIITVHGNGKFEIGMFLVGGGGGGHYYGGGGSGFLELSSIEVVIDGLSTINVEIGEGGSFDEDTNESGAGHPTRVFIQEYDPVVALGGNPGVHGYTSGGSGWSGGGSSRGGDGGSNGSNGENRKYFLNERKYYPLKGGNGTGQNLPLIAGGQISLAPGKGGTSQADWFGGGGGGLLVDGNGPKFKHDGVGEGYGGGGRKTDEANNGIAILWIKH